MDQRDYREARERLLLVGHALAVSGAKKAALTRAFTNIEKDVQDKKEALRLMLGVLYDGLAFGNWPWVKGGVDTLA